MKEIVRDLINYLYFSLKFPEVRTTFPIGYKTNKIDTIRIGKGVVLLKTKLGDATTIGDYTAVNENCQLLGCEPAPLIIGKYCLIASYSFVSTFTHPKIFAKMGHMPLDGKEYFSKVSESGKSISIGNNVWLGFNSTILPGVKIGDGAIVGAGSVVTKNVDPFSIVAGSPAKLIRKRFGDKIIKQLEEIKWWNWSLDKIRRNKKFFLTDLSNYQSDIKKLIEI